MHAFEFRLALRGLRRRPTFAAAVVLTLSVAIGATTAAFALVDAVFLTKLPVRDQDRLVVMWSLKPDISGFPRWPIPWDIRPIMLQQSNALSGIILTRVEVSASLFKAEKITHSAYVQLQQPAGLLAP